MNISYKEIYFNHIYVIESLLEDEKTGNNLFYDTINRKTYTNTNLTAEYWYVHSKSELITQLTIIKNNINNQGLIPYIHVEMHGNEYGLITARGEAVSWDEFILYLRDINILAENNLIISFATCHAAKLYGSVKITLPTPFVGFIAPEEKISRGDIEQGYTAFFESLLTDFKLIKALSKLNMTEDNEQFQFYDSESLFEYCWNNYYSEFDTPEKLSEYVELVLANAIKDNRMPPGYSIDKIRNTIIKSLESDLVLKNSKSKEDNFKHFMLSD